MRSIRSMLAATLLCAAASTAGAQANVKFMSAPSANAVTAFGYYVGPFSGTLLGGGQAGTTINLYCLDVLNAVTFGQQWRANFINLATGDMSLTRQGSAALATYRKAAWLTDQYAVQLSATGNRNDYDGIQAAIWQIFNPGNPDGDANNANGGGNESFWLNAAAGFASSAAYETYDYSRFTIVTDVAVSGVGAQRLTGGTQEFLSTAVVPEPGTYVLMATGLALVGGVARIRRRRE